MSKRRIEMTEVTEILYQWFKGTSQRQIAKSTGAARNTISKIIKKAISMGLSPGLVDEPRLLSLSAEISSWLAGISQTQLGSAQQHLQSFYEQIKTWHAEPHMTVRQMRRLLLEQSPEADISETSFHRYIKKHFPKPIVTTVVLHTLPGQQAQVDFGYVGKMFDPSTNKYRRTQAFVMTLSYSRHRFVKFVFKQDIATWIDCHVCAFKFFGGVPQTVLLDNLKAGVIKPDIYDPKINRSYAECARYYDFIVDPAKVRTPTHKGKVERSIQIVRQQIIAGRIFKHIGEANEYAKQWCANIIACTVTRTTGETPRHRFERDEKAALIPLPRVDYEFALWQESLVGRDQHITFKGSFYSVQTEYVGKKVLIKATQRMVYIFTQGTQIKAHPRLHRKGSWRTDPLDLPKSAKCYLDNTPEVCIAHAKGIGIATSTVISTLLARVSTSKLRKAQAILRLAEYNSPERLERACLYALQFGDTTVAALKKIIMHNIDQPVVNKASTLSVQELSEGAFLRDPNEFLVQ